MPLVHFEVKTQKEQTKNIRVFHVHYVQWLTLAIHLVLILVLRNYNLLL